MMSASSQRTTRPDPDDVAAAQRRVAAARARWHWVMFEMPKLSPVAIPELHEMKEAEARRQMIRADLDLFRLRGRQAS